MDYPPLFDFLFVVAALLNPLQGDKQPDSKVSTNRRNSYKSFEKGLRIIKKSSRSSRISHLELRNQD